MNQLQVLLGIPFSGAVYVSGKFGLCTFPESVLLMLLPQSENKMEETLVNKSKKTHVLGTFAFLF